MKKTTLVITALAITMAGSATAQEEESILILPNTRASEYWTPIEMVNPVYPLNAGRKREEGCATIAFVIEADGTTSTHSAVTSWPSSIFEAPAIDALRNWKFEPSPGNTKREPVYTNLTLSFQFDDRAVGQFNEERRETLAKICLARTNGARNAHAKPTG